MTKPLTFTQPYRTRANHETDAVEVYFYGEGRGTLAEFIAAVDEASGGMPHDQIRVAPGTTTWTSTATPEELASWAEHDAAHTARHEAWERSKYAELKAKFEGGDK